MVGNEERERENAMDGRYSLTICGRKFSHSNKKMAFFISFEALLLNSFGIGSGK